LSRIFHSEKTFGYPPWPSNILNMLKHVKSPTEIKTKLFLSIVSHLNSIYSYAEKDIIGKTYDRNDDMPDIHELSRSPDHITKLTSGSSERQRPSGNDDQSSNSLGGKRYAALILQLFVGGIQSLAIIELGPAKSMGHKVHSSALALGTDVHIRA
jgi:hypothetical protein